MSLRYVDNQELNPVSILIVKLVESGNLPPEWRSGVTAEYQHNRMPCGQSR